MYAPASTVGHSIARPLRMIGSNHVHVQVCTHEYTVVSKKSDAVHSAEDGQTCGPTGHGVCLARPGLSVGQHRPVVACQHMLHQWRPHRCTATLWFSCCHSTGTLLITVTAQMDRCCLLLFLRTLLERNIEKVKNMTRHTMWCRVDPDVNSRSIQLDRYTDAWTSDTDGLTSFTRH